MRILAILGLACLAAACATPGSLIGSAGKTERHSDRPAQDAAYCVARNAERVWPGINLQATADVQPGRQPGTFQVNHSSLGATVTVTEIAPEGTGSRLVLWYRWQPTVDFTSIPVRVLDGC